MIGITKPRHLYPGILANAYDRHLRAATAEPHCITRFQSFRHWNAFRLPGIHPPPRRLHCDEGCGEDEGEKDEQGGLMWKTPPLLTGP